MAERTYKRIATEEAFNFPEIMSEAVKVAAKQPPLIQPFRNAAGARVGRDPITGQEVSPASIGQFADGLDLSKPNWAGRPLYRPRDNLLCSMADWQS